jgi:uncharacterized protein with PQ loop repeat
MEIIMVIVDVLFSFGLVISAILMIPQIVKIHHEKNTEDFSLISYFGFEVFQVGVILHAIFVRDYALLFGISLCCVNNTITIVQIIYYKKHKNSQFTVDPTGRLN